MPQYGPFNDAVSGFLLLEQAYNHDSDMFKRFKQLRDEARLSAGNSTPLRFSPHSDYHFHVHVVLSGNQLGTLTVKLLNNEKDLFIALVSGSATVAITIVETAVGLLLAKVDDEDNPFGIQDEFFDDYYMKIALTHLIKYVTHQLEQQR